MHKITKGLKKKKKGKKSKRKDEDLFNPEELEAYRREHQGANAEAGAKNEEWNKFLSLTSGVDDVLKKTQTDLDRIKSTSFFQRVPTASEVKRHEEEVQRREQPEERKVEEKLEEAAVGIVEVSESEEEDEEDNDIFDTAYIDAIAAGEVKLAYIPESPTDNTLGDDPFDTSIAERAILGPAVATKGKKLVPLGAAVEVLTGRVQLPTCATKPVVSNRRQVLQQKDLLLGSFDNGNAPYSEESNATEVKERSLLDDDEIPIDEPIDLSKSIVLPEVGKVDEVVEKFDLNLVEDTEDDEEFAALAAESLSKKVTVITELPPVQTPAVVQETSENWKPFAEGEPTKTTTEEIDVDVDPFDTTFADNILPGKAELKVIESEILTNFEQNNTIQDEPHLSDDDFDPRAESPKQKSRTLSRPDVLNFTPSKTVSFELPSPEKDLLSISEDHSKIAKPLTPFYVRKNSVPIDPVAEENIDPFDTSFVCGIAPGKAELKIIESELFDPNVEQNLRLNDPSFDPRDDKTVDVVRIVQTIQGITSTDKADVKSPEPLDLLGLGDNIEGKVLTPASNVNDTDEISYSDPFDTSIACNILPGRTELKLLENELLSDDINDDFDPFDTSCAVNIKGKV